MSLVFLQIKRTRLSGSKRGDFFIKKEIFLDILRFQNILALLGRFAINLGGEMAFLLADLEARDSGRFLYTPLYTPNEHNGAWKWRI
jgi:hypothetical protein